MLWRARCNCHLRQAFYQGWYLRIRWDGLKRDSVFLRTMSVLFHKEDAQSHGQRQNSGFLFYSIKLLIFSRKLSFFPGELVSEIANEETTYSSQCWWLNCLWALPSIIISGPPGTFKDGASFERG